MARALTAREYTWPAEWAPHDATWIAWPHHEPDWPGKLAPIPWVYAEIVRVLSQHERVEIICQDERVDAEATTCLHSHGVAPGSYRLHRQRTNRAWLRDSAPTAVHRADGSVVWMNWDFNGWAKYENYGDDIHVGEFVARATKLPSIAPARPDGGRLVLEGGGLETDGLGTLIVTEEWLLSDTQIRNPDMTRADYERAFSEWLGITKTIWLGKGCVGDDTHGHVDDVARFVAPGLVVLAHEEDPEDDNYRPSRDNLKRLRAATDARGESLQVLTIPYPRAVMMDGVRLPASYANFYIANDVVIVPTFNDRNDGVALGTLAACFSDREVVGISSVDLAWGLGALHCLTQQQPASRA
jgi:agmatine deiminase